ncbi:uncharacterized protein MAL13P1.304 [Diaphorina citri]|uniref:Uncharacterized protein MAL13P1.304 n=1 Tax=Diaphorina citri TaxID=121845 RepID=A0A1S3DK65_DIACI|nr:uncharacterized protein MAL13P1.304 [Diaphorina citri]
MSVTLPDIKYQQKAAQSYNDSQENIRKSRIQKRIKRNDDKTATTEAYNGRFIRKKKVNRISEALYEIRVQYNITYGADNVTSVTLLRTPAKRRKRNVEGDEDLANEEVKDNNDGRYKRNVEPNGILVSNELKSNINRRHERNAGTKGDPPKEEAKANQSRRHKRNVEANAETHGNPANEELKAKKGRSQREFFMDNVADINRKAEEFYNQLQADPTYLNKIRADRNEVYAKTGTQIVTTHLKVLSPNLLKAATREGLEEESTKDMLPEKGTNRKYHKKSTSEESYNVADINRKAEEFYNQLQADPTYLNKIRAEFNNEFRAANCNKEEVIMDFMMRNQSDRDVFNMDAMIDQVADPKEREVLRRPVLGIRPEILYNRAKVKEFADLLERQGNGEPLNRPKRSDGTNGRQNELSQKGARRSYRQGNNEQPQNRAKRSDGQINNRQHNELPQNRAKRSDTQTNNRQHNEQPQKRVKRFYMSSLERERLKAWNLYYNITGDEKMMNELREGWKKNTTQVHYMRKRDIGNPQRVNPQKRVKRFDMSSLERERLKAWNLYYNITGDEAMMANLREGWKKNTTQVHYMRKRDLRSKRESAPDSNKAEQGPLGKTLILENFFQGNKVEANQVHANRAQAKQANENFFRGNKVDANQVLTRTTTLRRRITDNRMNDAVYDEKARRFCQLMGYDDAEALVERGEEKRGNGKRRRKRDNDVSGGNDNDITGGNDGNENNGCDKLMNGNVRNDANGNGNYRRDEVINRNENDRHDKASYKHDRIVNVVNKNGNANDRSDTNENDRHDKVSSENDSNVKVVNKNGNVRSDSNGNGNVPNKYGKPLKRPTTKLYAVLDYGDGPSRDIPIGQRKIRKNVVKINMGETFLRNQAQKLFWYKKLKREGPVTLNYKILTTYMQGENVTLKFIRKVYSSEESMEKIPDKKGIGKEMEEETNKKNYDRELTKYVDISRFSKEIQNLEDTPIRRKNDKLVQEYLKQHGLYPEKGLNPKETTPRTTFTGSNDLAPISKENNLGTNIPNDMTTHPLDNMPSQLLKIMSLLPVIQNKKNIKHVGDGVLKETYKDYLKGQKNVKEIKNKFASLFGGNPNIPLNIDTTHNHLIENPENKDDLKGALDMLYGKNNKEKRKMNEEELNLLDKCQRVNSILDQIIGNDTKKVNKICLDNRIDVNALDVDKVRKIGIEKGEQEETIKDRVETTRKFKARDEERSEQNIRQSREKLKKHTSRERKTHRKYTSEDIETDRKDSADLSTNAILGLVDKTVKGNKNDKDFNEFFDKFRADQDSRQDYSAKLKDLLNNKQKSPDIAYGEISEMDDKLKALAERICKQPSANDPPKSEEQSHEKKSNKRWKESLSRTEDEKKQRKSKKYHSNDDRYDSTRKKYRRFYKRKNSEDSKESIQESNSRRLQRHRKRDRKTRRKNQEESDTSRYRRKQKEDKKSDSSELRKIFQKKGELTEHDKDAMRRIFTGNNEKNIILPEDYEFERLRTHRENNDYFDEMQKKESKNDGTSRFDPDAIPKTFAEIVADERIHPDKTDESHGKRKDRSDNIKGRKSTKRDYKNERSSTSDSKDRNNRIKGRKTMGKDYKSERSSRSDSKEIGSIQTKLMNLMEREKTGVTE